MGRCDSCLVWLHNCGKTSGLVSEYRFADTVRGFGFIEFRHRCLALAVSVESRQLPSKKSIIGKVSLQPYQELARVGHVFLADVGDGQEDTREWGEQMAFCRGHLELGYAAG